MLNPTDFKINPDDFPQARPYDAHNQRLMQNVHPSDWVNPEPDGRYNMVVIGAGAGLGAIARTIHPYPTQAEAIKKAGDAYNRKRLTPRVQKIFNTLLRWRH